MNFKKRKKAELIIPPEAESDDKAIELARVWAAGGKQHVTLRVGLWDDPAAWGMMLVDLARHAANAYAEDTGHDVNRVLARIKEGFDIEWEHPTDQPSGKVL